MLGGEVVAYFENYQIEQKYATLISEIDQDGGNEIYGQLVPFWDGEDDRFNIQSVGDAKQFPNLKKVTLFYEEEPIVKNGFVELKKPIKVKWRDELDAVATKI